jgi:hypothetical protein
MAANVTDELGIHEAGLDELLRALTGPAEPAELAGEQSAVAMFRGRVTQPADAELAAPARVAWWAAAPGRFATRPIRKPVRWNLRLVAAAAVVVCGGMAAAAYAAALPAPVQRLVHDVFQFAGVPDSQAASGRAGSGHGTTPTARRPVVPTGPGGAAPSGATPSAGAVGSSVAAGAAVLSAAADSTQITAGTSVVISGQLSWPGHAVGGLTMTVLERSALTLDWHAVGSAPANAAGNGVVTVPVVATNAVFRVAVSGVAVSPNLRVTVVPAVSLALQVGSGGTTDLATVSAPYAQSGDVVVLQVSADGGGAWTYLRQGRLSVLRGTSFLLSASRLGNDEIRAVLLPTGLHAGSVSAPVSVPSG